MNFEDKVILVTGASRGIGAAIADNLGSAGATVVATATQVMVQRKYQIVLKA